MSVRGRPLHFWLCDWCDCKDDFTPIFDIFTCGRRDDVYPWGDFICCENDCALFGVFEVPLLAPPPLKENEWETGYCSFCNADFCPVFCPRAVFCPCCVAAENYSIMSGRRADGICGETGAGFCCCMFLCYTLGATSGAAVCTVIERRYIMKRYNIKGKNNPLCWLMGWLYCCALVQHRTLLLAKHEEGDAAKGGAESLLTAVTTQPGEE